VQVLLSGEKIIKAPFLDGISDVWEFLVQSIILFSQEECGIALDPSGLFQTMILEYELAKVLCHQHYLLTTFEPGSRLQNHMLHIWGALSVLGKALGLRNPSPKL
jgi:hypothetical protein